MQIRPATLADIPEMHRVRTSVRENRLRDPATVTLASYPQMLADHGRGWIGEENGRVVGFAVIDLRHANVWALFVDPAHEGRGIGRALHDAMVDWFFAPGRERLWLTTEPASRAQRFYERAGWRHTEQLTNGEARYELSRVDWLIAIGRRSAVDH
jgi:GNAT superfamily N-acetyltransferase